MNVTRLIVDVVTAALVTSSSALAADLYRAKSVDELQLMTLEELIVDALMACVEARAAFQGMETPHRTGWDVIEGYERARKARDYVTLIGRVVRVRQNLPKMPDWVQTFHHGMQPGQPAEYCSEAVSEAQTAFGLKEKDDR